MKSKISIQNMVKPSVVFFDLDHTLYDYDIAHEAAISKTSQRLEQLLGVSTSDFEKNLEAAKQAIKRRLGDVAASHSRIIYFKETLRLLGFGAQSLVPLELEQTYWNNFLREMTLFPNALDLLETLRIKGIPMVLITDLTTQIQLRKIAYLGLESYFDAVITSEESGAEKPSAAPFELAKEHLGISIPDAWFIGDNYSKDIVGAKLNLNAFTFLRMPGKDKSRTVEQFTDFTFSDFQEIIDIVVGLK